MNPYLVIIIFFVIGEYCINLLVETLNLTRGAGVLPKEFEGYFDPQRYEKSQRYLRETTRFGIAKDSFFTLVTVAAIFAGGFNLVDRIARSLCGSRQGPVITGLVFAGMLIFAAQLLEIPFSLYRTFVIEERYGFNRTTLRTFIFDRIKSWMLLIVIGGGMFSATIWFFETFGSIAWLYSWIAVTAIQLFAVFIAPIAILPLFNKFSPLNEGELKDALESLARQENFAMKGVFTMDGSRRSTKSNAFFTGFGRYRRIALFDTLIAKHSVDELVSILAHEIGHYKKRHVVKNVVFSIGISGLMFYILSFFINNPGLFAAFRMEERSLYASLFFFGFLYTPINFIFSLAHNMLSRRYEYEADAFAVSAYKRPEAFIAALKKLTVENLSNLTPHPLKVFFHYSHPPVLLRIEAIKHSGGIS